jgi:hypothetical protein
MKIKISDMEPKRIYFEKEKGKPHFTLEYSQGNQLELEDGSLVESEGGETYHFYHQQFACHKRPSTNTIDSVI